MYNHYISPTDAAMAGNHIKFNRISTPAYAGSILDIAMDKIDKVTNNFTGNQFKLTNLSSQPLNHITHYHLGNFTLKFIILSMKF